MTTLTKFQPTALDTLHKSLAKKSLDEFLMLDRTSVLLLDVSSSMNGHTDNDRAKIDELRATVAHIREANPDVPLVAFGGGNIAMVYDVPDAYGGTPMTEAIDYARSLGANHAVLISDGEPDNQATAMLAARNFRGVIDSYFIGTEGHPGARFLRDLSEATGGRSNVTDLMDPKMLAQGIIGLLPAPAASTIIITGDGR